MYLHIGNEVIVNDKNIIGIFDIDKSTVSKDSKRFLNYMQKNGSLTSISDDLPKSFIVCKEDGNPKIYISPISTATLKKRNLNNVERRM